VLPAASIIVPTRARPDYLEIALTSLAPQAISHGAEIVVVDDGSVPANRASARRHGARYIPHETPRGPNAARNTGIEASDADLLIFVDDDVEAPAGWLDTLISAAQLNPDYDVLGGPIRARLEGSHLRMCGREGPPITFLDLGPHDRDADFVWSANMLIRRSAFERVGVFDPGMQIYGDEEEWQRRYRAGGGRIRYIAAAAIVHRRAGRDARLGALSRAAWRRGRHSRRWDERKGTAPPLHAELRTLAGCLWHIPRRMCGNGFVLSAGAAGRVREALER
jgi:GT2 family glycosyltransferase